MEEVDNETYSPEHMEQIINGNPLENAGERFDAFMDNPDGYFEAARQRAQTEARREIADVFANIGDQNSVQETLDSLNL